MEVKAGKSIHIRRSIKYQPLIERVEQIATQNNCGEFTATIMDILELGIKSYDLGLRVVDHKLLDIKESNEVNKVMDVDREVSRSVFTSLAGSLGNLSLYESTKLIPNPDRITFYKLVNKALWREHANFSLSSAREVRDIFENIAPILKSIRGAKNNKERESIVEFHRKSLTNLIAKTKVSL